jgi:predicted nucleic-acid-binding Zn-ribbon protein
MSGLSVDQKRTITAALLEAGATRPCPRCGSEHFKLLDGYVMEFTQTQLRNMVVGSHNRFVTVASMCTQCGFLAQHALESLGLAPGDDGGEECGRKAQQIFT